MPSGFRSTLAVTFATLALAAAPLAASADELVSNRVHTVSTSGTPAFAALLNTGTEYSVRMRQALASGASDPSVEVAGVQLDGTGSSQLHTESTSGGPMYAALLNAGTHWSVAYRAGLVTHAQEAPGE